jgi:hypothetical protein
MLPILTHQLFQGSQYEGDFLMDEPTGLQFFVGASPTQQRVQYSTEITLQDIDLDDDDSSDNFNKNPTSKHPHNNNPPSTSKAIKKNLPKFVYDNGDIYFGLINDETHHRHGYGVYICKSTGARYEGEFENNERSGIGTHTTNSSVFSGTWENDRSEND